MARSASAQLVSFADREPLEATPATAAVLAPVELPRPRRPTWPTLASLAIATGLVALALGAWAIVSGADEGTTGLDRAQLDRALPLLAAPGAERIPLRGSVGRIVLVADRAGAALLSLAGLASAPDGYDYEAWVIPPESATPLPSTASSSTASWTFRASQARTMRARIVRASRETARPRSSSRRCV